MTEDTLPPSEHPLATSHEQFLHALKMVKLGYWHWDLISQQLTWSAETFHFLGMDPDRDHADMEVFINALHPDDRERVQRGNEAVMKTGSAPDMEFRVVQPNGEVIHLYTRAEMIYDREQRPVALFGTLQDVGKQKQQEMALKHTQARLESALAAKNEFLAMMSHELNTPMNAILGFSQLIHTELKDETLLSYSHEVIDASQKLTRAFGDILKYVELDKSLPRYTEVNLLALLDQLVQEQHATATERAIALSLVSSKENLDGFCSDTRMLNEVLKQLLTNAINYSPAGGEVTISLKLVQNEHLTITITDSGIGIPTHQRESIFVPFERLQGKSNISAIRGTGIGLTIARKLARTLGGDVQLLADSGQGASFELSLPYPAPPAG